jgi:hypothetical protein
MHFRLRPVFYSATPVWPRGPCAELAPLCDYGPRAVAGTQASALGTWLFFLAACGLRPSLQGRLNIHQRSVHTTFNAHLSHQARRLNLRQRATASARHRPEVSPLGRGIAAVWPDAQAALHGTDPLWCACVRACVRACVIGGHSDCGDPVQAHDRARARVTRGVRALDPSPRAGSARASLWNRSEYPVDCKEY